MKQQILIKYMMKKNMISKKIAPLLSCLVIACAIVLGGIHATAFAQGTVVAPPGVDDQLTVRISPEKPGPEENVNISIESFSTNINKAYIVWSVNGVAREEGPGITAFSFTTGKVGTVQKVTVSITTEDRRMINKSMTFAPAKIGMVVEADTYTPPFYKGKALFTPQATLKVVAFPEFVTTSGYRIPPENLVYTWKVDGNVIQGSSGYGKQYFQVEGNLVPRSMYVTAEISAYNSPLVAERTIQIDPSEPEILFYEESLLYGIRRESAFSQGVYLSGKEVKLVAEPYHLSVDIPESANVHYTWTLNGNIVTPLVRKNTIGLENRSGEAGFATLGLTIEHISKMLQTQTRSMQIEFAAEE